MMNTCTGRFQVDECWSETHETLQDGGRKRLKLGELEKNCDLRICFHVERVKMMGGGKRTGTGWTERGGEETKAGESGLRRS